MRPDRPLVAADVIPRRRLLAGLLAAGAASGCRNAGVARVILEGPEGSGIMGSKIFAILAEYQSSEAQRREAEQAALAAERRIVAAARAARAAPVAPAQPGADKPAEPAPPPAAPPEITAEERRALPPVLAVKVTEERRQGAATVMLWDTRAKSLAGLTVYDLKAEPPAGRKLTWQTSVASVQAVYTGDGWPN